MVSQIVLLLYIQKQKGVFQNMKKQKITTLLLTMVLCASAVLSGCAASQTEPNQSTTSSTPFEEAKDSGTPISSDEASSVQAYENDEVFPLRNRPKRSKNAGLRLLKSILSMNRMVWHTTRKGSFLLITGKSCGYFKDQINSNETNGFSYDDGVIDVEPIRDEDGTLTGLKQSSDADFNARTKEQEHWKPNWKRRELRPEVVALNKAIRIIVMTVWTHTPNLAFLMTRLLIIGCTTKSYLYPLRQGALHFLWQRCEWWHLLECCSWQGRQHWKVGFCG